MKDNYDFPKDIYVWGDSWIFSKDPKEYENGTVLGHYEFVEAVRASKDV